MLHSKRIWSRIVQGSPEMLTQELARFLGTGGQHHGRCQKSTNGGER